MANRKFNGNFKAEILMDLHVLRFPEAKNKILCSWSVCVPIISMSQKQIVAEMANLYSIFVPYVNAT